MIAGLLIGLAWKSGLCAGAVLLLLRLLRNRSAAERSMVAACGLLALLLLPASVALLPDIELAAPQKVATVMETIGALTASSSVPAPDVSAAGPSARPSWETVALAAYLLPALLLTLGLLHGIVRLWLIRAKAEVIEEAGWLAALARAQSRLGLKHGTALLASDALDSPVSWGALRPIIIVDRTTAQDPAQAGAIIAHELAHVTRLDWLRLLVGRAAICLFWFNPLVWMLARQSQQLCEEAADDSVLRADIGSVEYAAVLANAARQAARSPLLPINGVAPSRSSLSQRVAHVLDASRPRRPARTGWILASLALASGMNLGLAAAEPVLARPFTGTFDSQAGERAAAQLDRLGSPQARALALAMRDGNWAVRRGERKDGFREPAAVAPLVGALRDDQAVVRRIAAWGLSELGSMARPQAEAPVALLLRDPSPKVRASAARALGDMGATKRTAAAAGLLRDPDPAVRWHAAHALGDLQDPKTRPALEAALDDPEPRVRAKVAWAIRQVAEMESNLEKFGGG